MICSPSGSIPFLCVKYWPITEPWGSRNSSIRHPSTTTVLQTLDNPYQLLTSIHTDPIYGGPQTPSAHHNCTFQYRGCLRFQQYHTHKNLKMFWFKYSTLWLIDLKLTQINFRSLLTPLNPKKSLTELFSVKVFFNNAYKLFPYFDNNHSNLRILTPIIHGCTSVKQTNHPICTCIWFGWKQNTL